MLGRVASALGFIGGLFTLVGAVVAAVSSGLGRILGANSLSGAGGFIAEFIVFVVGIVMLFVSRPKWFMWRGRDLWDGVVLFFGGALAWILLGGELLVLVGAVLAVLAGLLFVVVAFSPRGWSSRRGWLRRRAF